MLPVTTLYASLLTLLFLILSARVILYRRAHMRDLGDEGDRKLLKRIRAQGNCAEYAPIGILLLLLAEAQGAPAIALHIMGLMLLLGRIMHAVALSVKRQIMVMRVGGMALTLTMLGGSALSLLVHAVF